MCFNAGIMTAIVAHESNAGLADVCFRAVLDDLRVRYDRKYAMKHHSSGNRSLLRSRGFTLYDRK